MWGNCGRAAGLRVVTLNMGTFPGIRIAHRLDEFSDLSLTAVHRLANGFATPALHNHLNNPDSPRLRLLLCVPVY
jgi:hypothetical protein